MSKEKKIVKMRFIGGEGARGDVKVGQIFELPEDWLEYKWFEAVDEEGEEEMKVLKSEGEEKPEETKPSEKVPQEVIKEEEMKPKPPPTPLPRVEILPLEELEKMTKKELLEYLNSHGLDLDPKLNKAQILQKAESLYTSQANENDRGLN